MHGGQFTLYTVRLQPHKIHLPPSKREWKLLSCQYYDTFMAINTPDVGMQIDGRKRILTDLSDQSLNNLSKHSINGTSQQQKCTS